MKKTIITDFYRNLDFKKKSLFKKAAMEQTGWSESTFQYKMRNNNLNKLEVQTCEKIMSEI